MLLNYPKGRSVVISECVRGFFTSSSNHRILMGLMMCCKGIITVAIRILYTIFLCD